jgi:membrane protein required for colicin V production
MNWVDYIILGVLGLSVIIGLWRGLVSEVLALAIWIAAFWVAWIFGPVVAQHFEHVISLPSVRIIAGYALCFVVVLVLGALLRFVVNKLVESTGLSGTDRLLGMLFGFARGVLLVTLLVFLVGFTAFTRDPWWQRSVLLPQFQHAAAWLEQHVPPGVRDHLHPPAVLPHLPGLPRALTAPISGASPMPAARSPTPRAKDAGQSTNP